ncbi:MAG: Lrp/AsnC family transcriptional regulator [Solirubrobacterales bacterium]
MLDQTDIEILNLLMRNSRIQWQEIGDEVHLTGQAVKNRISKMEKSGVIQGYTIKINPAEIGRNLIGFITVFMKTNDHVGFQTFIKNNPIINEAHRISGDGCYILRTATSTQSELTELLDEILKFGNYQLSLSIEDVK